MIRVLEDRVHTQTGLHYKELACLSTDSKPLGGLITGSLCLEVDTGDVYAYDETSTGTWAKIASLGGGS